MRSGGIGYRFVLESASWEASRRPGQVLSLRQKWVNRNASWCSHRYGLELVLTDSDGHAAWSGIDRTFDPRLWLAGTSYPVESRFVLPDDPRPGTYRLEIALVDDDARPAVRLAIRGDNGRGIYSLGQLTITTRTDAPRGAAHVIGDAPVHER